MDAVDGFFINRISNVPACAKSMGTGDRKMPKLQVRLKLNLV